MSNLNNGHRERRLKTEHRRRCEAVKAPCWLCHQPIDYSAAPNHPNSFESDHRISVKARPDLAYVLSNLAASHSRCNRSRGTDAAPTGQWVSADW